jgi:predicted nucleic acid-binding protein
LARVTVADAAPLIAFARIGQLGLLPRILGEVFVPETVAAECLVTGLPGALEIGEAFAIGQLIRHPDVDGDTATFPQLDTGETAAIHLALQMNAVLLIDERLGRAVARRLGLNVVGSLGVLIASKRLGLIASTKEAIEQMRGNGYYIADALIREALRRAGE